MPSYSVEELRVSWEKESDKYVLKAIRENLGEYPPEVRKIIKEVAHKRNLITLEEKEDERLPIKKIHSKGIPNLQSFKCPKCGCTEFQKFNEKEGLKYILLSKTLTILRYVILIGSVLVVLGIFHWFWLFLGVLAAFTWLIENLINTTNYYCRKCGIKDSGVYELEDVVYRHNSNTKE